MFALLFGVTLASFALVLGAVLKRLIGVIREAGVVYEVVWLGGIFFLGMTGAIIMTAALPLPEGIIGIVAGFALGSELATALTL